MAFLHNRAAESHEILTCTHFFSILAPFEWFCFRYQPATEEQLVKAFEVLDQDKKSQLTAEELKKLLTEEGLHTCI